MTRIKLAPAPTFELLWQEVGGGEYRREYRFHPLRRWRFDYAWPDLMAAVEVEGGVWSGGRHVRPEGYANDVEKYNSAVMLGWRVVRVTTRQLTQSYIGELWAWMQSLKG